MYVFTVLLSGLVVGLLSGLMPLIPALKRDKARLGWIGFATCGVLGLLSGGVVAIPAGIVFLSVVVPVSEDEESGA